MCEATSARASWWESRKSYILKAFSEIWEDEWWVDIPKPAFLVYDIDRDGLISNGELFQVLKMMVGANLKDQQLQQIVDKTILYNDKDGDGKINFEEFCAVSRDWCNHFVYAETDTIGIVLNA